MIIKRYFKYLFLLVILSNTLFGMQKETGQKPYSFANLSSWFTLPQFTAGNPVANEAHQYVISHFGNKTFNLCVLQVLAETINKTVLAGSSTRMAVPEFWAISSQDLAAFLNNQIQLDVLWNQFVQVQADQKDLDSKGLAILATIRERIAKVFATPVAIPEALKKEIEDFIQKYQTSLFMVRSTGYEDRTDIANAGGNESVAAVVPTIDAIWQAMGIVVQSYFSEKSLRQRLLAGDAITKSYFIPVLLQRMIGERPWQGSNPANLGEIPVSGVIFTQEAEGNTAGVVQIQAAYGHNQGVVNSLVDIDTFYCGPSGVIHPIIRKKMDRLVSVKKNNRFVLERAPNPAALQKRPTLDGKLVYDLKLIAQEVQRIYQYTMDIEFVVEQKNSSATLYVVQARPLIQRTYEQAPNYITDEYLATLPKEQIVAGMSIGVAGGFARTITESDQLIIHDDLPQALNEYHENPNRSKILAVVVSKMAPATSHEANQFRGYAVPVMVIAPENQTAVRQLLAQGPLLFDTQRALVVHKSEQALSSAIAFGWYTHPIPMLTSIIARYMLPQMSNLAKNYQTYIAQLSWKATDVDDSKQSTRELITLVKKSTDRKSVVNALKRIVHRVSMLARAKAMIASKKSKAEQEAASQYLQMFLTEGKQEQTLLDETKLVIANALLCAAEILYTGDTLNAMKLGSQAHRLAYLYPIKFLEATIFQQEDPNVVASYSYFVLRKMYQEDLESIEKLAPALPEPAETKKVVGAKIVEYLVQFEKIGVLALNPSIEKSWDNFVKSLAVEAKNKPAEQKAQLIVHLASTIAQLKNLNVLDLWLNTSFVQATQSGKSGFEVAQQLIDEVEGKGPKRQEEMSANQIIDWINQKNNVVNAWAHKLESWGDPAQFPVLYAQFEEQFINEIIVGTDEQAQNAYQKLMFAGSGIAPFSQNNLFNFIQQSPLIKNFNQANNLEKLIIVQFFRKVIDIYDRTIKAVTGSPAYKDKQAQVTRFAQLLIPYLALMESMITLVWDKEKDLILGMPPIKGFPEYLTKLRELFSKFYKQQDSKNLYASGKFSVGAAQIGSKVDFERALPLTLEDIFTLAHQNMLATTAILNTKYGITKEILPPFVQDISNMLERVVIYEGSKEAQVYKSSLIGIDYNYPLIQVYYNLPLRQHSSTFEIKYSKNKPDRAILTCKFFGHNEGSRMNGLVAYANLASLVSNIAFESAPITTAVYDEQAGSETTQFSWIITPQTSLNELTNYLQLFGKQTLNVNRNVALFFTQIDAIHPFLKDEVRAIIKKTDVSSIPTLIIDEIPLIDEKFLSKELFFNDWIIDSYIKAHRYDKALNVIKLSLPKIIDENQLGYFSTMSKKLEILATIPSVQKEAIEVLQKMLSSKKVIRYVIQKINRYRDFIRLLKKFKKDDKFEQQVSNILYKDFFVQTINLIENGRYYEAFGAVLTLLENAKNSPENYTYAQNSALKLIEASKVYEGIYELFNDAPAAGFVSTRQPGIQYQMAGIIAQRLQDAKANSLAEPIIKALEAKLQELQQQEQNEDTQKSIAVLKETLDRLKGA